MDKQQSAGWPDFLRNLAGYKKDIVEQCRVDSYHATIIGSLVLMVGIYAAIAWSFFFGTVFHNPFIAVGAGLFMGTFIVVFDRALIASMAGGRPRFLSLAFRMLLALLLGIFLSQPMILKFFEPEIEREAQILVDKKVLERKHELENLYAPEMTALAGQKKVLEKEIADAKTGRDQAEKDFRQEMDGSGGTGHRGYKDISKKKEALLAGRREEYARANAVSVPRLAVLQGRMDSLQNNITAETDTYRRENAAFGTLIRAEALQSLIAKDESGTLRSRYYLLGVILTLIELSALIGKLIFNSRSYAAKTTAYSDEEVKETEVRREIAFHDLETYKRQKLDGDGRKP